MKTDLLKKVRKRYDISYYPNGYHVGSRFVSGPHMRLTDKKDQWRTLSMRGEDKDESFKILYDILKDWIQRDYSNKRKKKIVKEKLWHV